MNMKTPKEWITEISQSGEGHECACICERCKNGRETFLLESDIRKIQSDALWHAAREIHNISRGTKSEDRAIAIDESRDLVAEMAKSANVKVSDGGGQ
jgi:hypothetical protein